LYHGTGVDFDEVDLSFAASEGMEFGPGFYVTPDFETAKEYALLAVVDNENEPLVYEYEFDSVAAILDLDVDIRKFNRFDMEWFRFVSDNLHDIEYHNSSTHDIIIGPLEQKGAWKILRDYSDDKISYEQAVSNLSNIDFQLQIVFKTDVGLKYLVKKGKKVVK
jgi:hypothetical protein